MITLFWVAMGLLFMLFLSWVVAPFMTRREPYRTEHRITHITEIHNSFNRYGGREHGIESTEQKEHDYEDNFGSWDENKRW